MDMDDRTNIAVMMTKLADIERRLSLLEGNLRWLTLLVAASVVGALLKLIGLG